MAFVEGEVPMSHAEGIPAAVPAVVRSTLAPGESVVWMGQPRNRLASIALLTVTVLCAAFWIIIVLHLRLGFSAVSVVFAVLGLVISMTPSLATFLRQRWVNRRTYYVLTDRRAIAFVPQRRRGYRVSENLPEDIAHVRRAGFLSGFESLYWVEPISSPFGRLGRWRAGFMHIDNAAEIQELMYETFLPLLPGRLKAPDPEVRRKAARSLTVLGPRAAKALPSLLDALGSDDSVIRRDIVSALGHLGEEGACAIPALRRIMLTDEDRRVATAARTAIDELQRCSASVP